MEESEITNLNNTFLCFKLLIQMSNSVLIKKIIIVTCNIKVNSRNEELKVENYFSCKLCEKSVIRQRYSKAAPQRNPWYIKGRLSHRNPVDWKQSLKAQPAVELIEHPISQHECRWTKRQVFCRCEEAGKYNSCALGESATDTREQFEGQIWTSSEP